MKKPDALLCDRLRRQFQSQLWDYLYGKLEYHLEFKLEDQLGIHLWGNLRERLKRFRR